MCTIFSPDIKPRFGPVKISANYSVKLCSPESGPVPRRVGSFLESGLIFSKAPEKWAELAPKYLNLNNLFISNFKFDLAVVEVSGMKCVINVC
jgi:hypothetical protein